jgi:hypothetical protein
MGDAENAPARQAHPNWNGVSDIAGQLMATSAAGRAIKLAKMGLDAQPRARNRPR